MDEIFEKHAIPGKKFNKFVDSKLPDWGNFLEELEPKEEELDRNAIQPFANAFENPPKKKSRKKKKEKTAPTTQDQVKQCLLNMIEEEIKKWDGEIVNTVAKEEDLRPEFKMDNVRTDITNEEVVNKYEEMVAKCKCKDCISEKEEYERMLKIAKEPDGLDNKERMLMNAMWSHKDRKYFRKKYELEKQEYGDPERWLNFSGNNNEEFAVNLEDYKKKTDSDDEDPLINFSKSLEKFELNFDPWNEEDESVFKNHPLFREFDQMFGKET